MNFIDLNSDLGESFGNYKLGDTAAILDIVSSANLACGFHAGDPMVMNETVKMCVEKGVVIGAHIGYPDLQGFGRRKMDMKEDEIYNMALYQLGALEAFTRVYGTKIRHINGHGALGNLSHKDPMVAHAIVHAAHDFDPNLLIAAHCEDQGIIKENTDKYKKEYGDDVPLALHPLLRSEEACYRSSELAVQLARETNARLHIMHISTAKELSLFSNVPLAQKRITAEACVSHLLFTEEDYQTLGARIKCNPAIKTAQDRKALQEAVNSGLIDAIATDHAPHLLSEKEGGALKAMSGMPMIQFSLVSMLELADKGVFTIEKVVEKMAHAPAQMYEIPNRGFIRKGYQADLVLVRPDSEWTVTTDCILSKCKWSPLEGHTFNWKVEKTFANGHLLYNNGEIDESYRGQELFFER